MELTSGFLTLMYSFFVWINVAVNVTLSQGVTRFKDLLLYNGMSILQYYLVFFLVEFLVLLLVSCLTFSDHHSGPPAAHHCTS